MHCSICFEDVSQLVLACGMGHFLCRECLKAYVSSMISNKLPKFNCVALDCNEKYDADLVATLVGDDLAAPFLKIVALVRNSNLRECPKCEGLVERVGSSNRMLCTSCKCTFCYLHGTSPFWRIPTAMRLTNLYQCFHIIH